MLRPRRYISAILGVSLLFFLGSGVSGQGSAEEALITQAQIDLNWMKTTAKTLSDMLDDARRARNAKQINCIEERLMEIHKIVKESEDAWQRLLDASARQDFPVIEKEAAAISKNRKKVEDLLNLVNECQAKIQRPGGFTEVTEEVDEEGEGDPTKEEDREGIPDPLPSDYEPPQRPSPDED